MVDFQSANKTETVAAVRRRLSTKGTQQIVCSDTPLAQTTRVAEARNLFSRSYAQTNFPGHVTKTETVVQLHEKLAHAQRAADPDL